MQYRQLSVRSIPREYFFYSSSSFRFNRSYSFPVLRPRLVFLMFLPFKRDFFTFIIVQILYDIIYILPDF